MAGKNLKRHFAMSDQVEVVGFLTFTKDELPGAVLGLLLFSSSTWKPLLSRFACHKRTAGG